MKSKMQPGVAAKEVRIGATPPYFSRGICVEIKSNAFALLGIGVNKINITLHAKPIITQKRYSAYLAIFVRLIFPSVAVGQCIFRNPPVSIISSLGRDSGDFCDFS